MRSGAVFSIEVAAALAEELIVSGFLRPGAVDDRGAVAQALQRAVTAMIERGHRTRIIVVGKPVEVRLGADDEAANLVVPGTNKCHELIQNRRRVMLVELDRLVADEPLITPRESEVAELVLRGFGNKVIARKLGLQVGTVKIHLHHIYQKLGVPNRMTLSKKLS